MRIGMGLALGVLLLAPVHADTLRVGIIIRAGADGLITRIDEYLDPADLAPLLNQE